MDRGRRALVRRKTRETAVELSLSLDGRGEARIATGVGFLDHMLDLFARHSLIDLSVKARGDTRVDDHHTVEDVGICLGQALREALGQKRGIRRFGSVAVPMEDDLAEAALDLGGRPFLVFRARFPAEKTGAFDTSLTREFLQAFVNNAGANLHVTVPYGDNAHHIAEAVFKGLARALRQAVELDPREKGIPSTKGTL